MKSQSITLRGVYLLNNYFTASADHLKSKIYGLMSKNFNKVPLKLNLTGSNKDLSNFFWEDADDIQVLQTTKYKRW